MALLLVYDWLCSITAELYNKKGTDFSVLFFLLTICLQLNLIKTVYI